MPHFDPDSISQSELHRLRDAAEKAWDDDTRPEKFQGHPQPSHGQCYVTSAWLVKRLGGHIGVKDGHFFWVSPDKAYVIDLTKDTRFEGAKLDSEDSGWYPTPDQRKWSPGPILYKTSKHPLFAGMRIKETPHNKRAEKFAQRADQAYDS
jgi:hypothetical protein